MTPPIKYSVSALTFPWLRFAEDLEVIGRSAATGIGLWEQKLLDEGIEVAAAADELERHGLSATLCLPPVWSIFPNPRFPEPSLPDDRVALISESIRRLARLSPACVMITPGTPAGMADDEAERFVIDALRRICDVAGEHDVAVGLEPIRASSGGYIPSLRRGLEFRELADRPNLGLVLDVYHLWDEPAILDLARTNAAALVGFQLNDWREPPRAKSDRLLPGDGTGRVAELVAAVVGGGFDGWYDLEVMSDQELPDSLWHLEPEEFMRRADDCVASVWNAAHGADGR